MATRPYRRRTVNPDFSTSNPEDMARQDRQVGYNYTDIFGDDYGDEEQRLREIGDQYRGQADELYGGMGVGLSEDEQSRILGDSDLRRGMTTDEEFQSNFMNEDEWMANQGNPNDRNRAYDPGQMEERTREGQGWRRGALERGSTGLREGVGQSAVDIRGALGKGDDESNAALDRNESNVRGAIGRIRSGVEEGLDEFDSRLSSNASNVQSRLDSAVNNPNLSVSDEEIQRMEDQSGRVIGNRYRSALNEVESAANRAGTTNPLALAELKGRVDRESAGQMADATSDARLKGIALKREVEGRNTDRRLGAAEIGGGFGERAATTIGRTRADIGMGLGEMESGAEQGLGQTRLASIGDRNRLRTGAETTIGGMRTGAEESIMNAGNRVEDANAADQQAMTRWNQETGIAAGRDLDDTNVDRARFNTINRQQTSRANQTQRFGQAVPIQQFTREGGVIARNARQQDESERRNYYTGQGQFNTNQSGQAGNRRIQGVGTGLDHAAGGTRNFQTYRTANPTLGRRLTDAGISAATRIGAGRLG